MNAHDSTPWPKRSAPVDVMMKSVHQCVERVRSCERPCWTGAVGGRRWESWDRADELSITLTGRTRSCSHGHACKPTRK